MTGSGQVAHIAHQFAQAAIDGDRWLPALEALGAATGSAHGEILFLDRRTHTPLAWWFTGALLIDPAEFMAVGGYRPTANVRIAATGTPMALVHEHHYDLLQPRLPEGEGVHDAFVSAEIEAGCQMVLLNDPDLLVGLAVLRGGRDGRTDAADRATFADLAPFARDAATISIGIERQGAALMAGAWEAIQGAAFVLDTRGRVVGRTRAAERLLAEGRLRCIDGRLEAPRAAAPFARAIAERLRGPRDLPPPLATVALPGAAGHDPLIADISALPRGDWSYGGAPAVLVVVRGGTLRREGAAALLAAAWDLSAAEAAVAVALAQGGSRSGIAAARGVSVETVRAQLRTIFAKAGVRREAELVARALALIGAG